MSLYTLDDPGDLVGPSLIGAFDGWVDAGSAATSALEQLALDGEVIGEAVYRDTGDGRIFTHSEINPAFEHQGFGTQMVRAALDDTRAAGLKPIGQCSMVRNFLAEHPDYRIPAFDFRGTPTGIDLFAVMASGTTPVIDGGLAGKEGGQIGAGVLRPRIEAFVAAADAYAQRYPTSPTA